MKLAAAAPGRVISHRFWTARMADRILVLMQNPISRTAYFTDLGETPEKLFLDAGYKPLACTSIALHAAELGGFGVPPLVIRWFSERREEAIAFGSSGCRNLVHRYPWPR